MSKRTKLFYIALAICPGLFCMPMSAFCSTAVLDSIRVENQGGKKVIIHVIEAKETYYSLGRKYGVAPKTIMAYNNNQALKINDLIRIPTEQPFTEIQAPPAPVATQGIREKQPVSEDVIKYKVGPGETLY